MDRTAARAFWTSLGLYTAVAFIAFFPCLVLGKAYFANDLLNQYAHFRAVVKDQLAQGHFPLWNPYLFGGQPFFADPNVMMAYPLLYPTLLFPVPYGLSVFFFLHMVLAALGMHLWLKSLRLSDNAARLGALTFALSGTFWWEIIHPPILAAYAWFPWVLFCLERLTQRWTAAWAFLTGLTFALVFCSGNFQSTTTVLYTGLPYFLFRLLKRDPSLPPLPGLWKKAPAVVLAGLLGGAPLLIHFIPAYEFSKYSNRRDASQTYDNFNSLFSMPPSSTYELLYPALGVPPGQTIEIAIQNITDTVYYSNDFLGAFGYIGIWAPFLFALAFRRKEKSLLLFLSGLGALSLLSAWGRFFPLHRLECMLLPGIDLSRAPFRIIQAYVLVGCVLAAFGFQTLERWMEETPARSNWAWAAGGYALLLFLLGLSHPDLAWREMLALVLGGVGILLGLATRTWKPLGRIFLGAGLLLPLLLSGWGDFSLGPPSNYDLETRFPAFSALKAERDKGRFFFTQDLSYPVEMNGRFYGWTFPQDGPMALGISQSAGYNPIVLTQASEIRQLPLLTYFRLMAVQAVVGSRPMADSPDFTDQSLGNIHLYLPKDPGDRLWAPDQVAALPDGIQVLAAMKSPGFDPRKQAFLEGTLPPGLADAKGPHKGFAYSILSEGTDHQDFQITMDRPGLVLFSEVMYPGWKAQVDGRPAAILTADHAFRALSLPAGPHQVEFLYRPLWAEPLAWGGLIWVLGTLLYGAFLLFGKREPKVEPTQA
ncbi:MAG TPA: hypothetical protein VHE12_08005 [bacterium]|nr:hypothetical protein [bacterium]